jgi:ATP-dependent Clp protease adaptor protein ClpS
MNTQYTYNTEEQIETDVLDMLGEQFNLIVWNDDINTFDWVIKTLIDVCGHEYEQAEQCAMFIHFKGKYAVKSGDFDILKPMCDAITDRGIGATVEEMAA